MTKLEKAANDWAEKRALLRFIDVFGFSFPKDMGNLEDLKKLVLKK